MNIHIGISESNRNAVAQKLSEILADEYVLYTKTRNAHWNVAGADFYDKHNFFESQFEELDEIIDRVAERIRSLGHPVQANLGYFLSSTQLSESDSTKTDSKHFIQELLLAHESIIQTLRANIKIFESDFEDIGSSDFITGLLQDHEKMAWFLRSHIQELT